MRNESLAHPSQLDFCTGPQLTTPNTAIVSLESTPTARFSPKSILPQMAIISTPRLIGPRYLHVPIPDVTLRSRWSANSLPAGIAGDFALSRSETAACVFVLRNPT
jgi:hypothetical protein